MKPRTIFEGLAPLGATEIGIYLPSKPYGVVLLIADELEADSRELLQRLDRDWNRIWPEVRNELEAGLSRYKRINQRLAEGEFWAGVEPMLPDENQWEADCEICFNFEGEGPQWYCYIKGFEIVHFQPVF